MTTPAKPRLLLVCPGRGSYNRSELRYFDRYASLPRGELSLRFLALADELRKADGAPTLSELDAADAFSPSLHLKGEHAAPLIFTASVADAALLDPARFDIAAVLGNSMGFYTALVLSGALSFKDGFRLVQTMGAMALRGAQIIYPVVDEDWRPDPAAAETLRRTVDAVNAEAGGYVVYSSIHLGGYEVLAGTDAGCKAVMEKLPKVKSGRNEYPFQLAGHSAFHTPVMQYASDQGRAELASLNWQSPGVHLIDGRGAIRRPIATPPVELRDYTLTTQVTDTFHFSAALRMGLREFAPDHVVLLGPGETLGGSIAQVLIQENRRGIDSKDAFLAAQEKHPYVINLARKDHREFLLGK